MVAFRPDSTQTINIKSSGQQTSQLNFAYVGEYTVFFNCVLRISPQILKKWAKPYLKIFFEKVFKFFGLKLTISLNTYSFKNKLVSNMVHI